MKLPIVRGLSIGISSTLTVMTIAQVVSDLVPSTVLKSALLQIRFYPEEMQLKHCTSNEEHCYIFL